MDLDVTVGQTVLIEVAAAKEQKVAGEVFGLSGNAVLLSLDAEDLKKVPEEWAVVSFPDELGVLRAEGPVSVDAAGLLRLEVKQVHQRQQRRSYVRAKTECEVVLYLPGKNFGDVESVQGITVDLSRGGARVQMRRQVPVGQIATLTLLLNGQRVTTLSEVLESCPDGVTRFEFKFVAGDGIEHLVSRVLSASLSTPGARKIKGH